MNNQPEAYEVAIIGLGPVGSALANILGQSGVRIVVLDRETSGYHLPRAVMFDDEIMRVFQSMGLANKMESISEVGGGARFIDADGNTLAHWARPQELSSNGWYVNYRFHQPDLENVLREGFGRYPKIFEKWGCEVTDLQQNHEGVTVTYRKTPTNATKTLRAAYGVGCDGTRSFTRSCINPEIQDLGFCEPWLVIDLLMRNPREIKNRESIHYCESDRSGTFVFLGDKRKRWEFRLNPDDRSEDICKPDFIWSLLERWISPAEAEIERATVYTFHSTIAKQWHDRRLFIAGDAAHQTPPFMGQGMCAGIRDAANLGWKLQAVLQNEAPEALLESYQIERYPHVKEYIDLTIKMGHMINRTASAIISGNATDPKDGPQTMSQLKPSLGPGLGIGSSPLIGGLFPQLKLSSGNLLDEDIGNGFVLISSASFQSEVTEIDRERFQKCNVTILNDTTDDLETWFKNRSIGAILLRPDRYILGTATNYSDLLDLLAFFENDSRKFCK